MSTVRTPKPPVVSPRELESGSPGVGDVRSDAQKPDFKVIRKRIAKRFPKTIEHLAK